MRNLAKSEPRTAAKFNDQTVRRQELGEELRRLRAAASLALREVAHITCLDASNIARVENGHRPPNRLHLERLLTAYRADRVTRHRLEALAEEADESGWWQRNRPEPTERQRTLVNLETKAERIVNFEPIVVPALLQTAEYTRAVMAESGIVPEKNIEDEMAARFCRHAVFEQWNPPLLLMIIDELVLHRIVGGPGIMRRQLHYLVECSRKKRITIRVVPNRGAHAGVLGSFEFIDQPDRPPVVLVAQAVSNLFIEQPSEVEVYQNIIKRLLHSALDEPQSVERVANLAKRLDTEEDTG
jgi:transcriptional regulator with XRE-family HTH domain